MMFPSPTSRLKLRNWQDADTETFIKMNSNRVVMEFFPSAYNKEETLESITRIKKGFETNGFGLYALEKIEDGLFIGFTGFSIPRFESFFTPCVEIGWRLDNAHWNRGFATEAAIACLHFGFTVLDFKTIHSFTSKVNIRSIHLMKKIGLQFLGTFDHPLIADGHILKPHVLYSLKKQDHLKK